MDRTSGTGKYEQLLARCRSLEPAPTAVAHPCEQTALAGAIEAGDLGLIVPILGVLSSLLICVSLTRDKLIAGALALGAGAIIYVVTRRPLPSSRA